MIAAPVLCAHARAVCRNRGFIGCQVKAREEALRFFFFFDFVVLSGDVAVKGNRAWDVARYVA